MAKETPLPHVSSFLTADQVFRQEGGKWCIIGVFNRIYSKTYPVLHPSLGLFVKLADALGDYQVKLEFQDSQGRILSNLEGIRLVVNDKLAEVELGIQTRLLPLPAPGTYFFKLYFNGQLVPSDIRVEATLLGEQK